MHYPKCSMCECRRRPDGTCSCAIPGDPTREHEAIHCNGLPTAASALSEVEREIAEHAAQLDIVTMPEQDLDALRRDCERVFFLGPENHTQKRMGRELRKSPSRRAEGQAGGKRRRGRNGGSE